MYEETIKGKPERLGPTRIPGDAGKAAEQSARETEGLMSQANRAVEQYAAKPTAVRHPLGRGIPADHEVFE